MDSTMTYEINYSNFQPSDDLKKLMYKNIENILLKAPSDAFLTVSVALQRELYKIDFQLSSKVSNIHKGVVGKNLLQTVNDLQNSVFSSLNDWRKSRNFSQECLN